MTATRPPPIHAVKMSGVKMDVLPRCKGPTCRGKGMLLARRLTRPWEIECPRCHFVNVRD